MNHLLLYMLLRESGPSLKGQKIEAIRILRPILSIELHRRSERQYLVVVLSTPGPFFFCSATDPVGAAGAAVLKRIHGERISAETEPPADRIVHLQLGKEALVTTLFGSGARVRVQSGDHIIESIDPAETGTRVPSTRPPQPTPAGIDPPFDLATDGRLGAVKPVSAGSTPDATHRFGPFESAIEACDTVGQAIVRIAHEAILDKLRGTLRRHADRRRRLSEKLAKELAQAEDFTTSRNEADILAAYQSQIAVGSTEVELPDLYEPETKRTIKLNPSVSISKQIEKRYKQAAKLERSLDALSARLSMVEAELSDITACLETSAHAAFQSAFASLQAALKKHRLLRQDKRVRTDAPAVKKHRRFDLDETWFVLVGRNDNENDEITFKIASQNDLWMHAQQVPGSHIVLRSNGAKGNPPKSILEQAASIAAFYSKARRSKLVPVIYTKRKYVRKFRGAKRGEVTCEREKTIFVVPAIPE